MKDLRFQTMLRTSAIASLTVYPSDEGSPSVRRKSRSVALRSTDLSPPSFVQYPYNSQVFEFVRFVIDHRYEYIMKFRKLNKEIHK